ncbi:MAG TPA: glycosyltransferase [Desulfosporosinus sp.]|nr:glycosyltransferase [Desulfosporosinus sp.]
MMNRIAFYISNHGYGHAARNIPIIEGLLEQDENLCIEIKTGRNLIDFMKQSLINYRSRIVYHPMSTDLGLILKPGSMDVYKEVLLREVKKFISTWAVRIEEERKWLLQNKIDCVVSDIVPWIFKSARLAAVKSVFISNFTWVENYKELFEEDVYQEYLHCYQEADLALVYPLAGEIKGYFKVTKEVGLSCRSFNEEKIQQIKDKYHMPIVFVSVGRSVELEGDIDVGELPYQFIFTEGIKLIGRNTELLPIDTENTQDYIKGADTIITKAGWGTVAEALCAQTPILVLRRDNVVEDRVTLRKLVELQIALPITMEELNANSIAELLGQLKVRNENYRDLSRRYSNGSSEIAEQLLEYLHKGSV